MQRSLAGLIGLALVLSAGCGWTTSQPPAEKKAAPPRMSSGRGGSPPCAWPMVIVKMTKVAPISRLALASAMA